MKQMNIYIKKREVLDIIKSMERTSWKYLKTEEWKWCKLTENRIFVLEEIKYHIYNLK